MDTENRLAVARGRSQGVVEMGGGGQRYILPDINLKSHQDVMYSKVTVVNNTVCYI